MKLLIVFAACIALSYAQPLYLNKTSSAHGRIIQGNPARLGDFPWQAGIFHYIDGDNGQKFCGGTLISDEWILTAAHCVYRASQFQIILGATRSLEQEPSKITLGAARALYHPYYDPNTLTNDVAVIQLERRVEFNEYIRPIRLANSNTIMPANYEAVVSGWGKTSDADPGINNYLYYTMLVTITNEDCKRYYQPNLVQDTVLCAGGHGSPSACHGDSGGPLYIIDVDRYPTHVGIVSFVSENGCEAGFPTGFTRTASYINFINANTGLNFP